MISYLSWGFNMDINSYSNIQTDDFIYTIKKII